MILESILSDVLVQLPVAIVTAAVIIGESRKSKVPCESCQNLKLKGVGGWKYKGTSNCPVGNFDHPPKYCKSYKKRDESGVL